MTLRNGYIIELRNCYKKYAIIFLGNITVESLSSLHPFRRVYKLG